MGHVLMENRHGLAVDTQLTLSSGTAEREAAEEMVSRVLGNHRITVGADKAYDTQDFVERLRSYTVTPHVAKKRSGLSDRPADDSTCRIQPQSAGAQASGRDLRVAEDRGHAAQAKASGT